MKKIKLLLVSGITALILVSCSDANVELAKKIKTDTSYIGKQVELSGRVNTRFSMFVSSSSKFWNVNLDTENPLNNQESESVSIKLTYGKGKNSIYLDVPDSQKEYKESDIKIFDNEGKLLDATDKIKIKGTVEKDGSSSVKIVDITMHKD